MTDQGTQMPVGESRIAENVVYQCPGQTLASLVDYFPGPPDLEVARTMRLVHVVNFYDSDDSRDIQEQVAETMRMAAGNGGGEVSLISVQQAAEPNDLTPHGFVAGRNLARDVNDIERFDTRRSLPLLFDVLDRAAEMAAPEDYIVFSNADICPMPHFYRVVREVLSSGVDAITINRRTIPPFRDFPAVSALALAELGTDHPGLDCFVFRRGLFDRFVRNDACLGIPGADLGLLYNLVAGAECLVMLEHVHMTYHYGDDRAWGTGDWLEHRLFNWRQITETFDGLARDKQVRDRLLAFSERYRESPFYKKVLKDRYAKRILSGSISG